jgi:hypothetical protein
MVSSRRSRLTWAGKGGLFGDPTDVFYRQTGSKYNRFDDDATYAIVCCNLVYSIK